MPYRSGAVKEAITIAPGNRGFDFYPLMRYRAAEIHLGGQTMQHKMDEPYSFSLIAPHGNMAALVKKVLADQPCTLSVYEGANLAEAAALAVSEVKERRPEIILSRGGTAEYIRPVVDVPVVSIPTSALDLLRTLHPFQGSVKTVAFFHYQKRMSEVQLVADILGITINEYTFRTREEMASRLTEAKAGGAELALGGVLVIQMREVAGLEGVLVEAGEDAIQRAVSEAFSIARVRRDEKQRRARMRTILDSVTDGILATNERNELDLINPTAEKLLGVTAKDAIGKAAREVVPNTRIAEVLRSGRAELNEIQIMGATTIVTNRVPILVRGKPVGVVCTFTEAGRIQQAEQHLRGSFRTKGFQARYALQDIITRDPVMTARKNLAAIYAATDSTILLEGESGTGKELFAQGIHRESARKNGAFVAVNCAAIPESLLESELFGYEEGAFTGARRHGKSGFFEMAHKGTLFLDEIGELPLAFQARLLRVLEEKEIVRVGGACVIPVDVRILCATNKNLEERTEAGLFRQDLYYRLNVLPLVIPPLRERDGDISLLAEEFLKNKLPAHIPFPDAREFAEEIAPVLAVRTWPGNVRELRNTMERLAIAASIMPGKPLREILAEVCPHARKEMEEGGLKAMTRAFERQIIMRRLEDCGHNHQEAARMLGISRMSLWRKINDKIAD